jgi:hypothetical protein
MNPSKQIAKHFRDLHYGGNWTCSNLKDNLANVTWQQAITQVHSFNTIATLVFHTNYFVEAVLKVLEGGPLDSKDEYSFHHPPIHSAEDWKKMVEKTFADADKFANLIEQMPEEKLEENIADPKYGNYYRKLHGIIEHTHYHLGQIALIKKLVILQEKNQEK